MFAYIVRRLVLMLVTLIGISIIIFVLLRVVPGNIVDILFDAAGFVDPADKANLEKELGLDQPIVVQYLHWIGGLLHGDLGYSYVSEKPALQEILPRIPITARLAGLALYVLGIDRHSLGRHQRGPSGHPARLCPAHRQPERAVAALVLARAADPDGVGLAVRIDADLQSESENLGRGVRDLLRSGDGGRLSQRRADDAHHPLLDAGNPAAGLYPHRPRQGRLRKASVNYRHALKNAILPVITVIGIEAAFLIGGLIVTETVFNIPGVARFLVEAIRWRDYPIVQNIVMLIAVVVVFAKLHRRHALRRDRSAHPLYG